VSPFDPTFQSRRTAFARASGVSAKGARGPAFVHPHHGVLRHAGSATDPLLLKISDAVALLGPQHVLGGWASLRVQGNTWFDDRVSEGERRDVGLHCLPGSQLRRRPGISPLRGLLHPEEIVSLEHYDVTTMARAAYDEMRLARDLRESVVVLDMATSTTHRLPHATLAAVERVVSMHVKTRGMAQARRALGLGSTRSASPWETRTRLVAELDAGITGLRVNPPVFDELGNLLGVVDLLDEATGLVIESDGGQHREVERHTDDNRREEELERGRLTVCRFTSLDHADRLAMAARMVRARRDAARERDRRWTLDQPDWWREWPPAARWR
jgi:hypothetical protein